MGIAFEMVKLPPPTKATTTEVVAEELCTIDVERIPTTSPTKGLDVIWMSFTEKSLPSNLKAPPKMSMLKKKQYKERIRTMGRRVLLCMV
jgi:hypothetical protein